MKYDQWKQTDNFKSTSLAIGAWILTPGTSTGVYKMVGTAVKNRVEATGSAGRNDIVLLGIASWGAVTARDRLEGSKVGYLRTRVQAQL